jgi:AraC-like DNA-binding protein
MNGGNVKNTESKAIGEFEINEQLSHFSASEVADLPGSNNSYAWLQKLYRVLTHQHAFPAFKEAVGCFLEQGCLRYRCDVGLVLKQLSSRVFEVVGHSFEAKDFYVGQHITTENFSVLSMHEEEHYVSVKNFYTGATHIDHKAYNQESKLSYVGISLELPDGDSGVLCFLSANLEELAGQDDTVFLELMAEGIASMIESQNANTMRKTTDMAAFASGSVKNLEEYQAQASIPEGLGISGKVVDVLKKRIGQSSLSIDNVAEELNLSKRTLQRRLQQQGVSFAELRDKVRFHYSIDYLVNQHISVDRISSTLDFSDRTSFTNAFKRWTGLSPSTFRKLFRDYV